MVYCSVVDSAAQTAAWSAEKKVGKKVAMKAALTAENLVVCLVDGLAVSMVDCLV